MKRVFALILMMAIYIQVFAETNKNIIDTRILPDFNSVNLAYFGETITHPGILVGIEYKILGNDWHTMFGTLNLGGYIHIRNHTALFINSEIGYRLTFSFGLFFDVSAGMGYLHTLIGAVTYAVTNGIAYEYISSGTPAFMPSLALGFGWDLIRNNILPIKVFIKAGVFGQYPFNTYMLPHLFIEAGLSYKFKTGK